MILQRTRLSRRRMIWLLPHPLPLPPSACCLSYSVLLRVELSDGRGEGVGVGAKSYDGEKAWSSIEVQNSNIISGFYFPFCHWAF